MSLIYLSIFLCSVFIFIEASFRSSCPNGSVRMAGTCISISKLDCENATCIDLNTCKKMITQALEERTSPPTELTTTARPKIIIEYTAANKKTDCSTSIQGYLVTAVSANFLLLCVVLVLMHKNRVLQRSRFIDRKNKNNTIECNDQGYVIMNSCKPKFEQIIKAGMAKHGATTEEQLSYDYVQMPVSNEQKYYEEIKNNALLAY